MFFLMENSISFTYQARYFTFGKFNAPHLILALHGYGQLANYFIKKFEVLNSEKYFVVVPEGLHRFYTNGTSGRVGASWMTKESRETDITNYIKFLNAISTEINFKNYHKITFLGFSQGGATASRFLAQSQFQVHQFILWAAVFPPDIDQSKFNFFAHTKNYFVIGDSDEYYKAEDIVKEEEKMNALNISMKFVRYTGNHNLDMNVLQSILDEN